MSCLGIADAHRGMPQVVQGPFDGFDGFHGIEFCGFQRCISDVQVILAQVVSQSDDHCLFLLNAVILVPCATDAAW